MPTAGKKSLLDLVKANPVVSVLATFAFLMTTITGTMTATGQLDALIVTHSELDTVLVPLSDQVDDNKRWNQCHRIELHIQRLEDRIWEREHNGSDPEALRDLREQLQRKKREFEAKDCAEVLDA